MTEREKELVRAYLPHARDRTLEDGEFYYLQSTSGGERVIRVFALDVLCCRDGTEYGIYQQKGGRLVRIDAGYGDPFRGIRMGSLYDNKEDCRDQTHIMFDGWEGLRHTQEAEGSETL